MMGFPPAFWVAHSADNQRGTQITSLRGFPSMAGGRRQQWLPKKNKAAGAV
jgi:hypothetical protein